MFCLTNIGKEGYNHFLHIIIIPRYYFFVLIYLYVLLIISSNRKYAPEPRREKKRIRISMFILFGPAFIIGFFAFSLIFKIGVSFISSILASSSCFVSSM